MINGGGLTKQDKSVGKGSVGQGDKAIALKLCRGILLRDFTIFHGGHFAILATGCDNMTVDNVTMDTNPAILQLPALAGLTSDELSGFGSVGGEHLRAVPFELLAHA